MTKFNLTLICRVDSLNHRIFISDQYGNTQGDCHPPTSADICEPYYRNGTMTQNRITNETVFTVVGNIDNNLNGNWTCRHGTRNDMAAVEVTVLNLNNKGE